MAEGLAAMHVRDVHLDDRELAGGERIEERDRGVREGSRVDDDATRALARLVDPVDQLELGVALAELDLELQLGADLAALRLDVGERLVAVDRRLALAEQVEVRPVQDIDDA